MRRVLSDEATIAVLFVLWCAITAVRAIYTRPPEVGWFCGILGTAVCMISVGWILHGLRGRK